MMTESVRRFGLSAVVMAALLPLFITVPWRDFQAHAHWDEVGWIPFVSWPVRGRDIALNLLLFGPLGIASALYFRRRVYAAGLLAFFLSFAGEWLQVYSHARFPSATDLVCNVVGAVVAAALVRWHLQRRA
jgi:glycopeptide antibiotics resistance protein